jgi:hypothetical protein
MAVCSLLVVKTTRSGQEGGHSCDDSEIDRDGGHGYDERMKPIAHKKKKATKRGSATGTAPSSMASRGEGESKSYASASITASDSVSASVSMPLPPGNLPPWASAVCKPSRDPPEDPSLPTSRLEVDVSTVCCYFHYLSPRDNPHSLFSVYFSLNFFS